MERVKLLGERDEQREDWMKRAIILATAALLVMLILAPGPLAAKQHRTTMQQEQTAEVTQAVGGRLAPTGGPAILLPAAALLLGSGVMTYAILRRR
jgi:hypothetical protein